MDKRSPRGSIDHNLTICKKSEQGVAGNDAFPACFRSGTEIAICVVCKIKWNRQRMDQNEIAVFQQAIEACEDPAEIARKVKRTFKRMPGEMALYFRLADADLRADFIRR